MIYKVVEASTVTDEVLEKIINEWVGKGFSFDTIHFAMTESSKRPRMAFLIFTKEGEDREIIKRTGLMNMSPDEEENSEI